MAMDHGPSTVRCAHILLKHTGSRNPINRNTNQRVTRSKEEAISMVRDYRNTIMSAPERDREFRRIATSISECSSASKGGDLGFFSREQMQASFSNAAFNLQVGEISDLVDSDSGIHIIYRIA
ncbi:putative Peptidyl-prolyl cis-trans isomerase NIMA-interacting 1 [Babesia bovis T2Bo]|uniref:putative Peptidyl-prolyl cis-trans isomerase NIMA-interacting 1 n=1 Tax=Babesia bovis T2Bo TaxID=484906 RepID=UPI001D4F791A|nr:putative Peptidyl-prolyl cis-trans isomerase NIMA-interacting 1 [Babesia bovis T2Bo]EDO05690.2 putative Peptidyl-prolyl cis-trans isomerase NIMA-interacting 1 [Babesia bovis T2Bo]